VSLTIGSTVDGYEVLDYIDSSTRRVAYRARNHAAGRLEQLHFLPDSVRNDPERSARFQRESRILAALHHPNIVTCYGAVEVAGQLAIAMELLEAVSLADRLDLGPMNIEDAVRTVLQVLAAAGAAHAAGVVHREISPANILVTPDQTVKLAGFGIAKSVQDVNLTTTGSIFGAVQYMAPEQVHGSLALDPRTDIYAIGCVFYALVTGRPPFDHASEYELLQAQVHLRPQPPSKLNPSLNHLLDAVVLKALEKNPALRYQSAAAFREAILNPHSVQMAPPPAVTAPPPVPPHPVPANSAPAFEPSRRQYHLPVQHAPAPVLPVPPAAANLQPQAAPLPPAPRSPQAQQESLAISPATILIAVLMVVLTAALGWLWYLYINSPA
jgi:eukaryotic-like serine/threonine-protein kinase